MERIAAFYYEHGYVTVRVDEPIVERREDGLHVTVKVDEGEQFRVGEVSLSGAGLEEVGDVRELLDRLSLKSGDVFSAGALRRDVEKVTDVFADVGYAFAAVEPTTNMRPMEQLVDILFAVDKGPQVYVDRIEVKGNVKTRDKVLRRELELQEQELFSGSKLRKSRAQLQRLGFFKSVDIKTRRASAPDRLDVTVEVAEGQTGSFSAGAGFSSTDRLLFNVRISEINLFGRGQRLVLNGDLGSLRRNLILSFTEPYLMDTHLTLGVDAFSWRLLFEDFTREGTGFGARVLYPLEELGLTKVGFVPLTDVRLGLAYRLELANITELAEYASRSARLEEGESLISSMTPRIRRNTLNHAFDPTAGSVHDFSVEFAGLGGETSFLKMEARSRWYYSFWESPTFGTFTYSIRGRLGWGFGDEGESGEELPLFERYFPGGLNSNRGYRVRSLGPLEQRRNTFGKVVDQTPIGGSQLLELSNEIIFPIVKGFGLKGVLFFDIGEAFTAKEGIQLGKLRYAAGGGVRWLSPFGPLRIGIGFPLNPRRQDKKSVILFSFGGPIM
jgi:outer membrane protein insertion porin family